MHVYACTTAISQLRNWQFAGMSWGLGGKSLVVLVGNVLRIEQNQPGQFIFEISVGGHVANTNSVK